MFTLFSSLLLISSLFVILTNNPIYAILALILVFCNTAGLLLLWNIDFIAFVIIIVYAGAIAMFFLFIIMMLNVQQPPQIKTNGWLLNQIIAILLCVAIIMYTIWYWQDMPAVIEQTYYSASNIEMIGDVLYTQYVYNFIVVAFILLIAMLGAITLTLSQKR